jgi:transposase
MGMLSPSPLVREIRRRTRRDPKPRFKPDVSSQLDVIAGCPAIFVAEGHLARKVRQLVNLLDFGDVEKKYSSLGTHGYDPRHVTAVLVFGSMVGLHHSTKLARALKTDAALRFLSGGHSISEGALRRFRRENRALFERGLAQTVVFAHKLKLIDPNALSVDSVRLRAHASYSAVRTLTRSEARLAELAKVEVALLSPEQQSKHKASVERHEAAVKDCNELERTNVVTTSPSASLMKFPNGASAPGHRVTVTAAGSKERIVIDMLIDGSTTDYGQLQAAAERARGALQAAGVPVIGPFQLSADAGYFSEADVIFAAANQSWVDVLLREPPERGLKSKSGEKFFTRADFTIADDKTAQCPAGKKMVGPYPDGPHRVRWNGVGCDSCPLRSQCTERKVRSLTIRPKFEEAKASMRARMALAGAAQRYNQRIATIEPVFSVLEDAMGFRRVSAQKQETVRAEITLKLLAYNIGRLLASAALRHVRVMLLLDFA